MTKQLDEDNYLTIQLLSYDKPTELTERYYFHEMSTLQATTLLPQDKKIISAKIFAYNDDNNYLDKKTTEGFKTIGDFNDFFQNNSEYYIHDCDIELENEINIGSHDDGVVTIEFLSNNLNIQIIESIFEKYQLNKKLIDTLKNKPGHLIALDNQSNITGDFVNFKDYLKNGRNR